MRYSVGQRVRVFAVTEDGIVIREIGKIVDVDMEWIYPYGVVFESGNTYSKELFSEDELEPMLEGKAVSFINIKFQEGAVKENGENGAQIEDVIDVLVDRLMQFQKSEFACRENALAITKLEEARLWLNERTRKRNEQGVEGKSENHE